MIAGEWMPTFEHILFIPAVLILGFVFGFVLGGKAARKEFDKRERAKKR